MKIRVTGEVVKVFELEVVSNTAVALRFRVELIAVYKKRNQFVARIWRQEFYRLQPSFPQKRSRPTLQSDEELLIDETTIIDSNAVAAKDWKTVLDRVIEQLKYRFGA